MAQPPGSATVLGARPDPTVTDVKGGVSHSGTEELRTNLVRNSTDLVQTPSSPADRGNALAPFRVPAAWAALANGTSAHAIEMDDVTTESSLHPGAAVIPAVLAVAEEIAAHEPGDMATDRPDHPPPQRNAVQDGRDSTLGARVIEAVAAGYEVTMRVGNALGAASSYQRGFHPTGVAGVFGAAVAAGKLMRLDAAGLERAIGIAGTMASGSLAYLDDGSWTKRLNPGWAAHGGVVAAGLASVGFTGPATALDGPHGVLRGYTDAPDPDRLAEGLGEAELQVMRVSIKPYGCCRYSHGLIDAVLALRAAHGIAPEDVEEMRLGVLSGGWPLIAEDIERKRDPQNVVDAQFSAPYAAAVALVSGRAGLAQFSEDLIRDERIRGLMARTSCHRDPSLDAAYPKSWPAAIEIRLRDGRLLRTRVEHALGEPENPVKREALIERFVEMVVAVPESSGFAPFPQLRGIPEPQARAVAERILHLDQEPDLAVLAVLA